MIVVGIIGLLALVAVPSFRDYLQRSKTTEAVSFLGEIKQRQEAYRAEFGQYCAVSGTTTFTAFTPAAVPVNGEPVTWPGGANWTQLGAAPGGAVRFQYGTIAGTPGTVPVVGGGLGITGNDFWFVSQARGDFDGDGTLLYIESLSATDSLWISEAKGWE